MISDSQRRLIEVSSPINYTLLRLIEETSSDVDETLTELEREGCNTGRECFVDNYLDARRQSQIESI